MSTEALSPADLQKSSSKKRKKEKDPSNSHSKKRRKAAENEEETIAPTTDTPKKKHNRTGEESIDDTVPAVQAKETEKKKHKKRKDKQSTIPNAAFSSPDDLLRTNSPFVTQTTSFYLALSPCAHNFPLEGLCAEHLSPLLLTYYPPLHGVVLSYSNPRISEHPDDAIEIKPGEHATKTLARSINEYAVTYVWLTADFVLLRPQRGKWLEGYVSLQNESLLGLMCYNYFNAVIPREKLPEEWRWNSESDGQISFSGKRRSDMNDDSGYFVDAEGNKIDGRILFRVDDFDATPSSDGTGGTISITGTLRTSDDGT